MSEFTHITKREHCFRLFKLCLSNEVARKHYREAYGRRPHNQYERDEGKKREALEDRGLATQVSQESAKPGTVSCVCERVCELRDALARNDSGQDCEVQVVDAVRRFLRRT